MERWSRQLSEGQIDIRETDLSDPGTPVRVSTPRQSDTPGSTMPSTPTMASYEGIPHKKRRFLQRLKEQEEASSSDGEPGETITKKNYVEDKDKVVEDDGKVEDASTASEGCDTPSKDSISTVTATETGQGDAARDGRVTNMAAELLGCWANLKVGRGEMPCLRLMGGRLCLECVNTGLGNKTF